MVNFASMVKHFRIRIPKECSVTELQERMLVMMDDLG